MTAITAPGTQLAIRTQHWWNNVRLWPWFVLVVVGFFVGAPLAFLILGSFSTARLPVDFSLATMGLANYSKVWLDPETYELFGNTFFYVTGATCVGIGVATTLAWLVERTNMPGKIWIYASIPMTLAMPGMLQAMAWVLLFSPRIGFANNFLKWIFDLDEMPFDIYTMTGMIVVEGLRLVPTAFLMLVPLLRSMDPTLEEAAAMSGARPTSTLRKITMKLMLPGILAVVIYQAMTALEVFEVPGILGLPAGIYVFSTKIYATLHTAMGTPDYGRANTLAIIYVVLAIGATYLYSRVISHSERFTIITGKAYRPKETDLGKWRWAGLALVMLFVFFSIVLPFLVLLYVSFLPFLQVPSAAAFKMMTLRNYTELLHTELLGTVLWNTVLMVIITSTLTVFVSFIVSLIIVRSRFAGRKLLDQLAFLPHAIPGIAMGLAFFWVFLKVDNLGIPIHGGVLAISIAFTVGFMAYGTRSMNAAIMQIHKDLEEAAQVSGAPSWRVMWRVFYPLMLPTIIGVWIWTMLHSVRQAGTPLILYEGPENQVLAVLVWTLWDHGGTEVVGAIGTLMVLALLLITLVLRLLGFTRRVSHT